MFFFLFCFFRFVCIFALLYIAFTKLCLVETGPIEPYFATQCFKSRLFECPVQFSRRTEVFCYQNHQLHHSIFVQICLSHSCIKPNRADRMYNCRCLRGFRYPASSLTVRRGYSADVSWNRDAKMSVNIATSTGMVFHECSEMVKYLSTRSYIGEFKRGR